MDDIGPCRRYPNIARDIDDRIHTKLAPARVIKQRPARGLERHQGCQVQPLLVSERTTRIAGADQQRAFFGEEARGVFADRAETLDDDPRSR